MLNSRITLMLCLIMLISCSVTKRHYRNGFYIAHHYKASETDAKESVVSCASITQHVFSNEKPFLPDKNISVHPEQHFSSVNVPEKLVVPPKKEFTWMKTVELAMPSLFKSEFDLRKNIPTSHEQNENTQQMADQYAKEALKYAIWAVLLSWTIIFGFILGVRAVNKAKLATMLSDGNYPEIDQKANRAILISQVLFISYTVALLLIIIWAFLRLA